MNPRYILYTICLADCLEIALVVLLVVRMLDYAQLTARESGEMEVVNGKRHLRSARKIVAGEDDGFSGTKMAEMELARVVAAEAA